LDRRGKDWTGEAGLEWTGLERTGEERNGKDFIFCGRVLKLVCKKINDCPRRSDTLERQGLRQMAHPTAAVQEGVSGNVADCRLLLDVCRIGKTWN